jgi:uncharacterized protein (DUF697 family)/tellurite resistance protein
MNSQDAHTIIAIAALAALADGNQSEAERASIAGAATRLGISSDDPLVHAAMQGDVDIDSLASRLSSDEARVAAYDTASAVCHADGELTPKESAFLSNLLRALGAVASSSDSHVTAGAAAAAISSSAPPAPPPAGDIDAFILDQAMLAAACELLPQSLSSMAILPLQLRMVYSIGQHHGQQLDMGQAKDLVAVLGIGAAGHMMEGIVRGVLGGVGRGLLGGILGGATGVAAGSTVTFATTYALGHAAEQYYVQGRRLSTADLKALFARFQGEASSIFPRVEERIRQLAAGTNLNSILGNLRA